MFWECFGMFQVLFNPHYPLQRKPIHPITLAIMLDKKMLIQDRGNLRKIMVGDIWEFGVPIFIQTPHGSANIALAHHLAVAHLRHFAQW